MPSTGPRVLTEGLLEAAAKERQPKKKAETTQQFLKRQTHLRLSEKRLSACAIPSSCVLPNLKTLYLYDNAIASLSGLGALSQLTHLHAYNNQISAIGADISGLQRLRKLYLNNNCLQSLSPLAPLVGLEELHASSQRLPEGEAFDLAPEALAGMRNLRVLSLAGNSLDTVAELAHCRSLHVVDLRRNRLRDADSVQPLLSASPIVDLDLSENGVDERYQLDKIIVACPTITRLNGRDRAKSERPDLTALVSRGIRSDPADGEPAGAV